MAVEPDPRPVSAQEVMLAVALQQMRAAYPARVRQIAGSWVEGLKGLLALAATVGAIGAPFASGRLSSDAQIVAGLLLVAVLAATVVALLFAMSAAYGTAKTDPRPVTYGELEQLRRTTGDRHRDHLRAGRAWAVVALVLLTGTIALAWLDPWDEAPVAVEIESSAGVTYCGGLLDAPPGSVAIFDEPEGRVEIGAVEVVSIDAIAACDD